MQTNSISRRIGKPALLSGIIATALLFFGLLIWPTQWRYEYIEINGHKVFARIQRLSGKTEEYTSTGWEERTGFSWSKDTYLPGTELARIVTERGVELNRYGSLTLKVYNGSSFHISRIYVEVTIASLGIDQRKYIFTNDLSTGINYVLEYGVSEMHSHARIESALVDPSEIHWKIVAAKGIRKE